MNDGRKRKPSVFRPLSLGDIRRNIVWTSRKRMLKPPGE